VRKRDAKADELCVLALVCVLRTNAKWVEMMSVHWYKATAEKDNTPVTLLDEDQIRSEMENFKKIVEVSNRWATVIVGGKCRRAQAHWVDVQEQI
jgi:diaminopimelate decarboxylase